MGRICTDQTSPRAQSADVEDVMNTNIEHANITQATGVVPPEPLPASRTYSDEVSCCHGRRRLAVLYIAMLNGVLVWAIYSTQMSGMIQTIKARVHADDLWLFGCYSAALLCAAVWCVTGVSVVASRCRILPHITGVAWGAGIIAVLLDSKLFSLLGVHIYDPLVLANIQNPHIGDELQVGSSTALTLIGVVITIIVCECIVTRVCVRWAASDHRYAARWRAALFGCAAMTATSTIFAVSFTKPAMRHDSPVLSALPLYAPLLSPARTQHPLTLHYPGQVPAAPPRMTRRPNILILVAESFRSDIVGVDHTPRLAKFAGAHATVRSKHHDAGCHVTEFGVFGLLYGLNAYHYSMFMNSRTPSYPLGVLKANGYELVGAAASRLSEWNYADFLFDDFDQYKQFASGCAHDDDRAMVEWITRWSQDRDPERPALLFVFFNSTHHNYVYPPEFEKHTPVLPNDHNYFVETDRLKDKRDLIFNRYLNSVAYVDHLAGKVLDAFHSEIESGDMIVLFTGDHGEEFWEQGLLGHSATRFVNERTRVPLILALPHVDTTVTISSHADIMPTILDYTELVPSVPAASYANGRSLLESSRPAFILTSGAGFPVSNDYIAVTTPTAKHWLRKHGPCMSDLSPVLSSDLDDNRHTTAGGPDLEALRPNVEKQLYRFLHEK